VAALGFYEKAYTLMRMPLDNITVVITPVLHPVLSSPEISPEKVFDVHKKLIEMMAFFGVPISIFLFFAAEPIVLILYGQQWAETISPFKWLALSVWIQMILSSTGAFFQINNKGKWLFVNGLISSFVLVTSILLGIYLNSITYIAKFLVIGFSLNLFQTFYFISKYVFKKKLSYFFLLTYKYMFVGFGLFAFNYVLVKKLSIPPFSLSVVVFFIITMTWLLFEKLWFHFLKRNKIQLKVN
jgi:PST family polysaccharide transporter